MAARARTRQVCVFCGARRRTTRDHIPPKCLFGPKGSRPSNLVTVPACAQCNMTSSGDDEYLRLILAGNIEATVHPETRKLWPTIARSLARPNKQGFARAFFSSLRTVDVVTPSGLFLGRQKGFPVDHDRLHRTMKKIIRGLFYHEFHKRLPRSHDVECLFVNSFRRLVPQREFSEWLDQIRWLLRGSTMRTIGRKDLIYCCNVAPGLTFTSVWGLTFYGSLHFVAFTGTASSFRKLREGKAARTPFGKIGY